MCYHNACLCNIETVHPSERNLVTDKLDSNLLVGDRLGGKEQFGMVYARYSYEKELCARMAYRVEVKPFP
jgi:hypothetical protein